MRIYKLNLDVDNYENCFIEETNISEDIFDTLCTATPLSFGNETVHFRYSGKDDKKIGDVLNCWDFCGYLINDKFCNLLATNNKIQAQYIKFQKDFILLNNTLVIDGLNSAKTKYEYFENDIIGVDKISEDTFRKYLSEFKEKYSKGTKIRSNTYPQLDGMELNGQYILEIPATNAMLSDIDYYKKIAEEYDVILRFTEEIKCLN